MSALKLRYEVKGFIGSDGALELADALELCPGACGRGLLVEGEAGCVA